MTVEAFDRAYRVGRTPWDMGGPTSFVERLADAGELKDDVLDAGCGTGDNAVYLAQQGHTVVGVDFAPTAITRAKRKVGRLEDRLSFHIADILTLEGFDKRFNTVIDCGLFHSFAKASDRAAYVATLARVSRRGAVVHMLCFSSNHEVDPDIGESCGTHGVTKAELKKAFRKPWVFDSLEHVEEWPDHFVWLASIRVR